MKTLKPSSCVAALVLTGGLLGFLPAAIAADDLFDPLMFPNGGFAPARDAQYAKECGACHFAYLPGMLPARSWKVVMDGASRHFGQDLHLPADTSRRLAGWLADNAADKSDSRGSARILRYLPDQSAPARITELPAMVRFHYIVRNVLRTTKTALVRRLTNCDECHVGAAAGSFANRELDVPYAMEIVTIGSRSR